MKALPIMAALAFASAGPAATRRASSLAGSWAFTPEPHRPGALQSDSCGNDSGVHYAPDGTWSDLMPGEEGRWSVRGRVLSERVTHRHGAAGRRRVNETVGWARLRWFSPDHVNTEKGRDKLGLLRCPASRRKG